MRLWVGTLVIVTIALVGTACSSDTGSVAPTSTISSVEIDMSDFRFAPATLTVTAGTSIQIELRNSGSVIHNWAVLTSEITNESEFDEALVLFIGEAPAGAQATYTFQPPEVGNYQIICTIPTHLSQGMQGTLIVEEE